jgi:hypothetical protein
VDGGKGDGGVGGGGGVVGGGGGGAGGGLGGGESDGDSHSIIRGSCAVPRLSFAWNEIVVVHTDTLLPLSYLNLISSSSMFP